MSIRVVWLPQNLRTVRVVSFRCTPAMSQWSVNSAWSGGCSCMRQPQRTAPSGIQLAPLIPTVRGGAPSTRALQELNELGNLGLLLRSSGLAYTAEVMACSGERW